MLSIDLNADIGESTLFRPYDIGKDIELMQLMSSVNIACGYHAGDPATLRALATLAMKWEIAIGAHPSFPDREHFGRLPMQFSPRQITDLVADQLNWSGKILGEMGAPLHHVKPHGALYNMAANNREIADAICQAIGEFDALVILYGLSGSELIKAGARAGLRTCSEAFADRTYQDDGNLTPRPEPFSLINLAGEAASQAIRMIRQGMVGSLSGQDIPILAETICVHGDGEHALELAKGIRRQLVANGIAVQFPGSKGLASR